MTLINKTNKATKLKHFKLHKAGISYHTVSYHIVHIQILLYQRCVNNNIIPNRIIGYSLLKSSMHIDLLLSTQRQ